MKKIRILVVDDDPNACALLQTVLEKTGRFEVRTESRSAQAINIAIEFRPALVVLDVDMPGKDGGTVAAELRAVPDLAAVPILFLTSLISRSETQGGAVLRAGEWFLAKPPQGPVLVEEIFRRIHATHAMRDTNAVAAR